MIFSLGEHHVVKMRSYGSFKVVGEGDSIFKPVPNMIMKDQDGNTFSLEDLKGSTVLFDFFQLPCDEACMKKGVTLVNYLNDVSEQDKWKVLSICLNEETSLEELKDLQNKHMPEMGNWKFAKAMDKPQLNAFLEYTFVSTGQLKSRDELPSKHFVLIDQQGVIREFFDSRVHKENKKLQDAIKLLLKEPYMTWKETKR
jgi:cytochrome oxidase Cu insertion factor (SCO1/SenC/PrrC family)